jgi:hypothetical protein
MDSLGQQSKWQRFQYGGTARWTRRPICSKLTIQYSVDVTDFHFAHTYKEMLFVLTLLVICTHRRDLIPYQNVILFVCCLFLVYRLLTPKGYVDYRIPKDKRNRSWRLPKTTT